VCERVIARTLASNRNLDMRLLVNTFMDRAQWHHDDSTTHWHDLLESRLKERVIVSETHECRASRIKRDQDIAIELSKMKILRKERERLWMERTGKSVRAYYRRIKDIKSAPAEDNAQQDSGSRDVLPIPRIDHVPFETSLNLPEGG
jgi:hypothetical protein